MLASVGLQTEQRSVSQEFLGLTSPPSFVRLEQREFDADTEGDVADACLRRAQSNVKARRPRCSRGAAADVRRPHCVAPSHSLSRPLTSAHRSGSRLARGERRR